MKNLLITGSVVGLTTVILSLIAPAANAESTATALDPNLASASSSATRLQTLESIDGMDLGNQNDQPNRDRLNRNPLETLYPLGVINARDIVSPMSTGQLRSGLTQEAGYPEGNTQQVTILSTDQ